MTAFNSKTTTEARILAAMKRAEIEEAKARKSREEKRIAAAKKSNSTTAMLITSYSTIESPMYSLIFSNRIFSTSTPTS